MRAPCPLVRRGAKGPAWWYPKNPTHQPCFSGLWTWDLVFIVYCTRTISGSHCGNCLDFEIPGSGHVTATVTHARRRSRALARRRREARSSKWRHTDGAGAVEPSLVSGRAAECPRLTSIGVPAVAAMSPASLMGWIDADLPVGAAVRKTPAKESGTGPFGYWAKWNMDRVEATTGCATGVRRLTRLTQTHHHSHSPRHSCTQIYYRRPQRQSRTMAVRYWITGLGRYMAVHEVARAFGLRDGSPLTLELCACARPASAVQMLGRAIHAGVALALLRTLDRGGLLPPIMRYASACSGIDTFAEAVDVLRARARGSICACG